MKIIFDNELDPPHHQKVEITGDGEDMQSMYELIQQALLGMGFHPETVKEYFPDEKN